ncbi:erythronate-4-phosphate dehydrogenase [Halopseudomonas formosensis]|uniref:Erythronate-4-phosphate dehydrogenase n=1 Tax=Halopseudomonas formosensis TaxID=1002526 RepID=A0A1I6ARN7_9GAMM|nr:4-phosphoerythronate dehydrogenase PdxB [Halopseudomonas formosensis]SFQ71345.1 erythronate-4-phosphate dehydrogenase [Halopseudomonas formosensis]
MHIVADENIPLLDEFFGEFGRLTRLPGRLIDQTALGDADVLLVRSVTRVSAAMLAGTPVRFVGTCTIGTDHLDLPGLAAAGIEVASAPGCNARGVVEYVLSCLLTFAEQSATPWQDRTVGIIGVGEVGGRLAAVLQALGVKTLLCDPPLAEQGREGLIELDELIAHSDVISCHVPLTREGPHPTWHLLDGRRLERLRPGTWLINSSRGPVIDNQALSAVLGQRPDLLVALDVWETEPLVDPALAARCRLATPHIAGYSLDGKLRGTAQIYQALCRFLDRPASLALEQLAPRSGAGQWQLEPGTPPDWALTRALRLVYDVRDDDARLRAMLNRVQDEQESREGFDRLRKEYPLRRECNLLRVVTAASEPQLARRLLAAGFDLGG